MYTSDCCRATSRPVPLAHSISACEDQVLLDVRRCAWIAQERTQPLAEALKNAPAATAAVRRSAYDPLPDMLRLERGAGTPVMTSRDVPSSIGIMLRRDSDFDSIVGAFRCAAASPALQPSA